MDYEDSPNTSATWAVHEECTVRWSGDGEIYPATIKSFQKKTTVTLALVSFHDFDSEDDEWVDTSKLTKKKLHKKKDDDALILEPSGEKNSSPVKLTAEEQERKRLEEKYRFLEVEEENSPSACSRALSVTPRWKTTTKKLILNKSPSDEISRKRPSKPLKITGGQPKTRTSKPRTRANETTDALESFSNTFNLHDSDEDSKKDNNAAYCCDGFTDEDMEKPYFPKVETPVQEPLILSKSEEEEVKVPATINRYLRDYQRDGVRFLYKHYAENHGALLADDMGLGKTVQVIAFIAAILGRTGTKVDVLARKPSFIRKLSDNVDKVMDFPKRDPFLIIGPATVLYNWVDEFQTWGYFTVSKYHKQYKAQTVMDLKRKKTDIVVTTYETCRDNIKELNAFNWEAIFADEVHKIKGLKAEVTNALRKFRCLRRYGLTGTPLQNSVVELWSLLDWCIPGCLGNLPSFKGKYAKRIESGQKHNATKRELAESRKAQEKLSKERDKWMIRRTKAIIKDQLPDKSESVVYCRPTELQTNVYKAIFDLEYMEDVLKQADPCPCDSGYKRAKCCYKKLNNGRSVWAQTMCYMHLLLKAANHIALLLPNHTASENQRLEAEKVCETVFSSHPQFVQQTRKAAFKTLSDPKFCGKMKVLQGLLSVFKKKKCKILLFSYSTKLLDILETYVMSMGYEYHRLDGKTKESQRVHLVREFNNDPNVFLFLISTKAGGVGLNLTGANVVIIYDPNWNPTHDLQAQDRAYRIGQRRDVKVYRLITSGTIEENIYLRQLHKQQIGNVAVTSKNAKRLFYTKELFGIQSTFHFRFGDGCLTEDILSRHAKIEEELVRPKEDHQDPDLQGFEVEKYVPSASPTEKDGEQVEDGEEQEDSEEPSQDDEAEEKDEDFGLDYVCSQLVGMESSEDDLHEETSPKTSPRSGQGPSRSKVRGQLQASQAPECLNDSEEQSMDKFLDDFLESGVKSRPCPKKSPSKSTLKRQSTKFVRKDTTVDISPKVKKSQLEVDQKNDAKSVKKKAHFEENSLDDLWEEMESMNSEEILPKTYKPPRTLPPKKQTRFATRSAETFEEVDHSKKGKNVSKGGPFKSTLKKKPDSEEIMETSVLTGGGTMECDILDSDSDREKHSKRSKRSRKSQRKQVKIQESRNRIHVDETGISDFDSEQKDEKNGESGRKGIGKSNLETGATFGSVSDVFAECGVVHMHQNQRVTGGSRAEDHMSRCAVQDVYERHCNTQVPAALCEPWQQTTDESSEDEPPPPKQRSAATKKKAATKKGSKGPKTKSEAEDAGFFYGPRSVVLGSRKVLIGQTPKAIRRQHLEKLAQDISPGSNTAEVAHQILNSTRTQQLDWLQTFYSKQNPGLAELIQNKTNS